MMNKVKNLFTGEEGQGMTEYGLIIGLIAIVLIGVLTAMSGSIKGVFEEISTKLGGAIGS